MKKSRPEYVLVWVDAVTARSHAARLCLIDGRDVWIPLSAVELGEVEPGAVSIAAWLARKENLPEHEEADDPPLPDPTAPVTMFSCSRGSRPIGRVSSKAFGTGDLLRVEGDKSVVRFADGKVRTMGSRYLEPLS